MIAEHENALSAVRRALELVLVLGDDDSAIVAAGLAGLKVLEGSEEEGHA
jgi:hypothetical protein